MPGLGCIVHHTDAEREWAYDRESHIGKLDQALDEAIERKWLVVDMKTDWRRLYPFREIAETEASGQLQDSNEERADMAKSKSGEG